MSNITLESLGLTKDEITERIITRICAELLETPTFDEDGEPDGAQTTAFAKLLQKKVVERTDKAVEEIAGRNVLPNVAAYVEGLCLQQTNTWGEKVGTPVTFVEYLTQRAETYLHEKVDHNGKGKSEESYNWNGKQTRLTYLVHEHLQYTISTAMKEAVSIVNKAIVPALTETVKAKLGEIQTQLSVTAKTKD